MTSATRSTRSRAERRSSPRAHVATLGPGDVFGEMALLASGRRTATVTSTSPMRLIALFKRDVWALERQKPQTAAQLRELIADRLPALLAERRAAGLMSL